MLNMDFNQYVVIDTNQMEWLPSPAGGVLRKPLARAEKESGHATSIVRYEAGAKFNSHPHPLGEEILVLDGVFSDESGDYGKGSYIRNPPGSQHAPYSEKGCTIFVKLHQFASDDKQQFVIDTLNTCWQESSGKQMLTLHHYGTERVCLHKLKTGVELTDDFVGDEEALILSGSLIDANRTYPEGTWIRNGSNKLRRLKAQQDTVVWLKTGHLSADQSLAK